MIYEKYYKNRKNNKILIKNEIITLNHSISLSHNALIEKYEMFSVTDDYVIYKKRKLEERSIELEALSQQITSTSTVRETINNNNNNNVDKNADTFHVAIGPVLVIAQCFGIMPVVNVMQRDPRKLRFQWRSLRSLVTIILILSGFITAILFLKSLLKTGISAKNIVGVIFFCCCTFAMLLFLFLAQKWCDIIGLWSSHESFFLKSSYEQPNYRLSTKLRATAAVIFSLSMLEHLLFLSSSIYNLHMRNVHCKQEVKDHWKQFFMSNFKFIFDAIPYNFIITIYLEFTNISFTFAWNYMDLFIILISLGISTRMKQLNKRLLKIKGQVVEERLWYEIRMDYVRICEILDFVDSNISSLVLLSCANNLYFICFQLLNIFNPLPYLINWIYFWYSLFYLVGRTIYIFLCAAAIHDASKAPLDILRFVPTKGWCDEIERFIEQIKAKEIALSGKQFFLLTRKLMLGMAGTIITYELVLLQFDDKQVEFSPNIKC